MTYRHFKYEGWLYALAFATALGMRLIQLGAMPLADAEAAPALQALRISQGENPALAAHPFYILSTSIAFFLYGGGTNFLARFIPALIGSLLVFAPLLFDNRLKPRPSLILAFFIALDPGLVAISRQAASPIFAIAFLVFALGFINKKQFQLAGVFAALALLGGPSLWLGVLGLGIAWMIYQLFNRSQSSIFNFSNFKLSNLIPFIVTFILAGSLFFIVPNGLSAALGSIPAFFSRWLALSDVPAGRLFLALLVYHPLLVLLALTAIFRGWLNGSPRIIPISIWLLVSLLLAVFLPSRQIADLSWTLLPLAALAALELARNFNIFPEERREVAGVVLLVAFIWTFAWLAFSGLIWIPPDSPAYINRFLFFLGALVLLILSLLLVGLGWSTRTARLGGVWGMVLVLGLLGLGGAFGSAGMRGIASPELWWLSSIPTEANLLRATVQDVSRIGFGEKNAASVVIAGVDSPALEWVLREHNVTRVETPGGISAPDIVITPWEIDPFLAAAYRGQEFPWRQNPLWNASPQNIWFRWVVLRDMPQSGETLILWVRDDLFLDR
jgi:hypothetical protein